MKIEELLRLMVEKGASDLHLRVMRPPTLRIDGALKVMEGMPHVTPSDLKEAFEHVTNESQRQNFRNELELDLAYSIEAWLASESMCLCSAAPSVWPFGEFLSKCPL